MNGLSWNLAQTRLIMEALAKEPVTCPPMVAHS